MTRVMLLAVAAVALAQLDTLNASGGSGNGRTEIFARLTGQGIGKARFRERVSGRRDFQVEAQKLRVAAGTQVTIFVNGVPVGTTLVTALRTIKLEISTEQGQAVPAIRRGDLVQVNAGTTVLVSGRF